MKTRHQKEMKRNVTQTHPTLLLIVMKHLQWMMIKCEYFLTIMEKISCVTIKIFLICLVMCSLSTVMVSVLAQERAFIEG